MPPKAAARPSDRDASKELKDLQLLLTCLKTFPNAIKVDYEELAKELKDQSLDLGKDAVRMRVHRMAKALDVTITAATGAAADGDARPKAKPGLRKAKLGLKKAGVKENTTKSSGEDDEVDESPKKKQKLQKDTKTLKDEDEE